MIRSIDEKLLTAARALILGRPKRLTLMRDLTALGGDLVTILVVVVASYALLAVGRPTEALRFALVVGGARLLVVAIKQVARRARPAADDMAVEVHTSSFPSGHALMSMVLYPGVAMLMQPSAWSIAAALLLSGLIGLSRLVLGAHWPSDVAAGLAIGLAWLLGITALSS